ncbi:MAG: hypothetical protein WCB12_23125 [Bryobacteraceae bacterium]
MKLIRRLAFWGIVGALLFAGGAFAQVTMELTGVGTGANLGGVYTSPYVASINGTSTYVICDDFLNDISIGDVWQAYQNPLSSVTSSGPQMFTTPDYSPYTIQQEYDAAAILAEDVLNTFLSNSPLAEEYSFAIWTLFDPAAINGYGGNTLSVSQQNLALGFMNSALAQAATSGAPSGVNVTIYTPDGSITGGPDGGKGLTAQEFLVISTPEASLSATLGVSLASLVGLIFLMRRRLVRAG